MNYCLMNWGKVLLLLTLRVSTSNMQISNMPSVRTLPRQFMCSFVTRLSIAFITLAEHDKPFGRTDVIRVYKGRNFGSRASFRKGCSSKSNSF